MSRDGVPSEAHEPLMGGSGSTSGHDDHHHHDHHHNHSETLDDDRDAVTAPITFRNAGKVVRFLTCSAGLSGLLFGFDTGVISSTLVSVGADLSNRPLTTPDKALVTAITSLLALIAAPSTGYLADRYGRKAVILGPAVFFAVGALIQAFARYVWIMALGRALVGAAVGVASGAVPLYITELAPAELRGRLVTIQSLFVTGGQVVAYLIGFGFATWPHGWRWMVGIGAVPAVVQLVLLGWMPETPRWLLQVGREQQAHEVLSGVYGPLPARHREVVVQHVLTNIKDEIKAEHKTFTVDEDAPTGSRGFWTTARELVGVSGNRRALTIACLLQGVQQLCGFNSLMYFSATIFSLVGFNSPIGTSLSIALTNLVFTLVAFAYIDKIGRRRILLGSIPFMVVGLLTCSVSFRFIRIDEARSWATYDPRERESAWPTMLLLSLILYVAAYAVGLGCVPWQQSELFALRVRSLGSGLATATNWSSNFVIGMTFLPMMAYIGPSVTFALYAVVCVLGWICIWHIYPETAGLELEGIGELLKTGWGVERSMIRFREWREMQEEQSDLDSQPGC